MALPDISELSSAELRQLADMAYTEFNRRSLLAEGPAMVAEVLVRVHDNGGDYAQVSAAGLQMAQDQITAEPPL